MNDIIITPTTANMIITVVVIICGSVVVCKILDCFFGNRNSGCDESSDEYEQ